jgi:hypothetical protein
VTFRQRHDCPTSGEIEAQIIWWLMTQLQLQLTDGGRQPNILHLGVDGVAVDGVALS